MVSAIDEFEGRVDYEWGALKSTSWPQQFPAWVDRLKEKVDLWLHDESFVYLGFGKNDYVLEDATELTIFGLTERFALSVTIRRDPVNPQRADAQWKLVPRSSITHLDAAHAPCPRGGRWLVVEATFDGVVSGPFPDREDLAYDAESRRAIFDGLRGDLYPR